jgi:hypothetical protein
VEILGFILALTLSQQSRPAMERLEMSALVPMVSERLADYLKQVETKTQRAVVVYIEPEQATSSGGSAFFNHTTDGELRITLTYPVDFSSEHTEASIAHEATHGLLIYGENYCNAGFRMPRAVESRQQFDALQGQFGAFEVMTSILEDINVDKRIQNAGFVPVDDVYRDNLREGLDAARTGRDPYPRGVRRQHRMAHNIFNNYILAWAFREYLILSDEDRALMTDYITAFEAAYPEDFERAQQIRNLIETHNIFTRQGHGQILRGSVEILGLENVQVTCAD